MRTVKFLKAKSYGGTAFKVGATIPMRADHANLLQILGVVVIEDSPVVKLPIPGQPAELIDQTDPKPAASILTPKPEVPEPAGQPTGQMPESPSEDGKANTEPAGEQSPDNKEDEQDLDGTDEEKPETSDNAAPAKDKPAKKNSRRNSQTEK